MDNEVTYKDDITVQLRRAATFSMIAGNRQMLETAADEIDRLRLTDAEREALEWLAAVESPFPEEEQQFAVVRGLMERLR